MREAFRAYKEYIKTLKPEEQKLKSATKLVGLETFSDEQLFFISFANVSDTKLVHEIREQVICRLPSGKYKSLFAGWNPESNSLICRNPAGN